MRIAYLCKRQYMNHDVIVDRYARLYEQPYQLARLGHDVLGVCMSYRMTDERDEMHETGAGSLRWVGISPDGMGVLGLLNYPTRVMGLLREFRPDIIIGASDASHIILSRWLANRVAVPFAADLYDHFETFGLSRIPGIIPLYRRAIRKAAVVTCVSKPLADLVRHDYMAEGTVLSLPSTINRNLFYPRDRRACRENLGLPLEAKLIGTAGGLSREKGIEPLYRAFEILAESNPDIHMVLAGQVDPACPLPPHPRVHYLGMLSHAQTAELFCALDVGVVYLRDTPYGRFSFPQKAYEIAACGVPMAVAGVGAMAGLFGPDTQSVYQPDKVESLVSCIKKQLVHPETPMVEIKDWPSLAKLMESAYFQVIARH